LCPNAIAPADLYAGPDATPIVFPLRPASKEYHRTLSHLPQQSNLQSAPMARFLLSWWANELRIWHIHNPARKILDADTAGQDIRRNRKLLGQILVQGESNITSAAISNDGTLLVASTSTEVKAFQLRYDGASSSARLHVRKVIVLEASAATKVEISPDRSWVCWVDEGDKVMAARVSSDDGSAYAISHPYRLHRLRRQTAKYILLGGLGSYDRRVTQIAFSPDSRILCVADLAGYIDTWVLRLPGKPKNSINGEVDDEASSTSSIESLDEEAERPEERWFRNPSAALLPRLGAIPVALTFAPTRLEEGSEYSLVAVTTNRSIFVFDPLRGSLSDWTRRNPISKFPESFRMQRDVVKGIIWQGPRAWIYGVSYLFMIDLSRDLPEPDPREDGQKKGTKRKRNGHEAGAGGKMNMDHSLVPQEIKTTNGADGVEWVDVDMADADDQKSVGASSAFDDDDDDTDPGELQRMRDGQGANGEDAPKRAPWWNTYQYRPILGIVPLSSAPSKKRRGGAASDRLPPLEVAIVERPRFELDLPPRYFANGEWER